MKILSIEQHNEIYETFILAQTVKSELSEFTFAEWLQAYMYIIAPAGVDTFCESELFDDEYDILLESNEINEGFFKDIKNVLKGRKLVKAKYKGFDQAAKNYVSQSSKISDSDKEAAQKDKQRQALKKQYDAAIKAIEDKVKKPLDDLKKESPVVAKYEKYAKLKYQMNLTKLAKKFQVSMAKVKAYNAEVNDIKREIADIAGEIKSIESEVKDKAKDEKGKGKTDAKKADNGKSDKAPKEDSKNDEPKEDNKVAKLEADIKGYNDAASQAQEEITKSQEKLKDLEDQKARATDPEKIDKLIAKEKQLIDDNKEDIAELKAKEKKAKAELDKLSESRIYEVKSLKDFL